MSDTAILPLRRPSAPFPESLVAGPSARPALADRLTISPVSATVTRLGEQYDTDAATITVEVPRLILELGRAGLFVPAAASEAVRA